MYKTSATSCTCIMKRQRAIQKYRPDWEKFSEFKGWLFPEPNSCYKAQCKACNQIMVADITVLRNHSRSIKHYKNTCNTDNTIDRKIPKLDSDSSDEFQMKHPSPKDSVTYSGDNNKIGLHSYCYHSTNCVKMDCKNKDVHKAFVTKPAPFWKAIALVNGYVTDLNLSDYSGCYLVLFFYPQNFSKVCSSELIALNKRISEFKAINVEVVACSVDSYLSHQVWLNALRTDGQNAILQIPLISDQTHAISKSYGCYLPELGHSLRAYYIIDVRGILRHMTINDLPVGHNIGELLRLLRAFKYSDETETLCPANWEPSKERIL